MWFFVNKITGKVEGHSGLVQAGEDLSLVPLAHALPNFLTSRSDLAESDLATFQVTALDEAEALTVVSLDQLEPALNGDTVESLGVSDPAPDPPALYVHTTLTGGIQSPAGTLYLKNDGIDALQVHAELRDGPDPATSAAVTQLEGQDITAMWALELVNVDTGALADTPLVQMTAGVIDVNYTTTIAPCEVELAEDRLQPIGDYQLKLAQPVRFKAVRMLI